MEYALRFPHSLCGMSFFRHAQAALKMLRSLRVCGYEIFYSSSAASTMSVSKRSPLRST